MRKIHHRLFFINKKLAYIYHLSLMAGVHYLINLIYPHIWVINFIFLSSVIKIIIVSWNAEWGSIRKMSAIIHDVAAALPQPFLSLSFHRSENSSQKPELHRTHAANPESLFVRFCDRSSKRGSNWRTPTTASFFRGSATSAFQRVKTHLCAKRSTHSALAGKGELSFNRCTLL